MCAVIETIKDWQELLAGLLGFGGVAFAVFYSAYLDRQKRFQDERNLRLALGIELRDMAKNVLRAYRELPGQGVATPVDQLGAIVRFVTPVIYNQTGARITAVGKGTTAVVYFYSQVNFCEEGVRRVTNARAPASHLDERQRADVRDALANALRAAQVAIQYLEPVSDTIREKDTEFMAEVTTALTR
jgi:hypothetical protein